MGLTYALMRHGRFIFPMPRSREQCEAYLKGCKPGTTEMVAIVPVAEVDRLRAIEAELDQTQDDLVYALHTRNLVLERAAAEVLPGPDGQDDIDRRALVSRWMDEAHDEAGMTPRPLPSVEMLRQLGPNVGEVIRELNRLRAIEAETADLRRAMAEDRHEVQFGENSWTVAHPLRERIDGSLFDCAVSFGHLEGPPAEGPGRYWLNADGSLTVALLDGAR